MSQENVEIVRGQESIVLATFPSRYAAERMLASLGRKFRREARKGKTNVFVVSGNADGSLKLTESRAVEASGAISTLIHVTSSILVGFTGIISTLKGAVGLRRASRVRASHVGSDDMRSHAILAQAGPDAAVALVRCKDQETRQMVTAKATDSAITTWDGTLTEFLADLDPGSKHDWVRTALGEPSSADHEAAGLRGQATAEPHLQLRDHASSDLISMFKRRAQAAIRLYFVSAITAADPPLCRRVAG